MPRRSSSLTSSATSVASSSASSDGRDSYKSPLSALPAVPDLRFEQSYISTIRGFLHETDKEQAQQEKSEELDEKRSSGQRDDAEGEVEVGDESSSAAPQKPHHLQRTRASDGEREIWIGALRVEWVPLLYVTIRDQVLSPLVQGAVWGIGSILLGKFSAFVRTGLQQSREQRSRQPSQARQGAASTTTSRQRSGGLLDALGLTGARRRP